MTTEYFPIYHLGHKKEKQGKRKGLIAVSFHCICTKRRQNVGLPLPLGRKGFLRSQNSATNPSHQDLKYGESWRNSGYLCEFQPIYVLRNPIKSNPNAVGRQREPSISGRGHIKLCSCASLEKLYTLNQGAISQCPFAMS